MRVFVGTLHSDEGEFEESCSAIVNQIDVDVTHIIISNLPELEAHNQLWNNWNRHKHEYDLFVKVDADTVLRKSSTISEICKLFVTNPRVTAVQAPLYDYMTDGNIYGLNCFSSRVVFKTSQDKLYCDRVDSGNDIVLRTDELTTLAPSLVPAGYHCCKPTDIQAFHYGVHRGLKKQQDTLTKVRRAWERNKDRQRKLALLGEEASSKFSHDDHHYSSDKLNSLFQEALKRVM